MDEVNGLPLLDEQLGDQFEDRHYVSPSCMEEKCRMCPKPATHKIGEEIDLSDPTAFANLKGHRIAIRHNFTAYVCCMCYRMIMGDAVSCEPDDKFIHASQNCLCPMCKKPYKKHYTDGVLHYLCTGRKVKL